MSSCRVNGITCGAGGHPPPSLAARTSGSSRVNQVRKQRMAPRNAERTPPTVCIVESLEFLQEDSLKEGEIISRTLRLSDKPAHYTYLRSSDEMKAFAKEFGRSKHRYLHVSCHGNASAFFTTTGRMSAVDFAEMLAPYVDNRRVFLSACQAAQSEFAKSLLSNSECWSVLAPVNNIYFDDAAIFWSAFYHIMFKDNPDTMNRSGIERTVKKCADLINAEFSCFSARMARSNRRRSARRRNAEADGTKVFGAPE
jgi:hypothetical protein